MCVEGSSELPLKHELSDDFIFQGFLWDLGLKIKLVGFETEGPWERLNESLSANFSKLLRRFHFVVSAAQSFT